MFNMIAGANGWPTSKEVADELRRLDPEGHGSMVRMSYTPGTGEPRTTTEIAQAILDASKTATLSSSSGIYDTKEIAEAKVADYVGNPDYITEVSQVQDGPKAGRWRGKVTHKDAVDL